MWAIRYNIWARDTALDCSAKGRAYLYYIMGIVEDYIIVWYVIWKETKKKKKKEKRMARKKI